MQSEQFDEDPRIARFDSVNHDFAGIRESRVVLKDKLFLKLFDQIDRSGLKQDTSVFTQMIESPTPGQ
jgi:hypothetical protein